MQPYNPLYDPSWVCTLLNGVKHIASSWEYMPCSNVISYPTPELRIYGKGSVTITHHVGDALVNGDPCLWREVEAKVREILEN